MNRKAVVFVVCICGLLNMSGIVVAQQQRALFRGDAVRQGNRSEMRQKITRLREIPVEIRNAVDDRERDELAEELETLVAELFDSELQRTEQISLGCKRTSIGKSEIANS